MTSTTHKSGGKRKVVSDEVSQLKDSIALLTSAVADLKKNTSQVDKPYFKKCSLSATQFKPIPAHVEKTSTQVYLDDTLTEQALRIAELEAKNELLEDKFNNLLGQITTFMGLCNKHTNDITELRHVHKNISKFSNVICMLVA